MNADRLLALYEKVAEAPDAVPRLRRFVLDLAVRGKLVAQVPTDEPASDLLKRIAAEKARLVKAGEIKKPKEAQSTDPDNAPFDLPRSWRWVRLTDILTKLTDGTHHSPPNGPEGEFLYITAKNIKDDGVKLDNVTYVSRKIHAEICARCNPEPGDILYIKDGATTGIVTVNDLDQPFSMLSSVALLKLPPSLFNQLVVVFLRSPFFYEQMRSFMKGAAITRVTLKRMGPALLPLPPLAEQRRIVAKVEELMALLDRLEAARTAREATRDRLTAASLARLTAPDADPAEFPTHARSALATLPALTTRPDQIKPLRRTILNLAVQGKLVEQDPTEEPAPDLLKRISKDIADHIHADRRAGDDPKAEKVSEDAAAPFVLPPVLGLDPAFGALSRFRVTDGDHVSPVSRAETASHFERIGYTITTGASNFAGYRQGIDRFLLFDKPSSCSLAKMGRTSIIPSSTPIAFIAVRCWSIQMKPWVNNAMLTMLDGFDRGMPPASAPRTRLVICRLTLSLSAATTGTAQPNC